jgi:Ca-activated chloride channel homolog
MTERDLNTLKDFPVPAPSVDAKRQAVATALAAFDVSNELPSGTQGVAAAPSLTDVSSIKKERQGMRYNRKVYWSVAASIAAVMLALPVVMSHLGNQRDLRVVQPADAPARQEVPAPASSQPLSANTGVRPAPPAVAPAPAPPTQNAEAKVKDELAKSAEKQSVAAATGRTANEQSARPRDVLANANPPATVPATPPAPAPTTGRMQAQPPNVTGGWSAQTSDAPIAPNNNSRSRFGYLGDTSLNQPVIDNRDKLECPPGRMCLKIDPQTGAKGYVFDDSNLFDVTSPNPIKSTRAEPVSTFSIDVDTASYSLARRHLNQGRLPPKASVRVEEMINYFKYDYRRPESATAPFEPQITVTPSPWNANTKLVHIALKGYEIKAAERPRANIVLLVDISGSMGPSDRLPLLKTAFKMMVDELKPDDTVGIVTYASGSDIRLSPTKVADKARILAAIDSLGAGGSTAGAAGLTDAYRIAETNFDPKAVNRIILGTDGDWNVGITNRDELTAFVERKRATGIFLSILGVGMGNHNDALMQKLAQNGNGVAAYIDTLPEARKVLVDEISSSLFTIAKDVKIQVEFNPARVSEYRLIGYESRALRREDFNNDKVDAGDVGSGHSVTAIYEITPAGSPAVAMPDLRYGQPPVTEPARTAPAAAAGAINDGEYGFFKLRYKLPNEETSRLIEVAVTPNLDKGTLAAASDDVRFSIAVAAYGQLLSGTPYLGAMTFDDVIALANSARGADLFGLRAEFINLARLAKSAQP